MFCVTLTSVFQGHVRFKHVGHLVVALLVSFLLFIMFFFSVQCLCLMGCIKQGGWSLRWSLSSSNLGGSGQSFAEENGLLGYMSREVLDILFRNCLPHFQSLCLCIANRQYSHFTVCRGFGSSLPVLESDSYGSCGWPKKRVQRQLHISPSLSSSPSQPPENSRFVLISMSCMLLCLFVTECNRCGFAQATQNECFAISGIEEQGHFASLSCQHSSKLNHKR